MLKLIRQRNPFCLSGNSAPEKREENAFVEENLRDRN